MARLPFNTIQDSDQTTAKIAVLSLFNTQPTLSVSMGTITNATPTVVQAGTDGVGGVTDSADSAPVAMFSWTFDITGLTSGTQGTYTATQGADVINGLFNTQPSISDTDDFIIAHGNCDGPGSYTDDVGSWAYVKNLAQTQNVPCCIFSDDTGYQDTFTPNDPAITTDLRWLSDKPNILLTEYAYVCSFASYLGLTDGAFSVDASPPINPLRYHTPDRNWCFQNIPFKRTFGDHEGLKWLGNDGTSAGDRSPTVAILDLLSNAWKKTIGAAQYYADPLHPTRHVAIHGTVGPVEIIGTDRQCGLEPDLAISNATTLVNSGGVAAHNPPTVSGRRMGTAQMADLQGLINSTSPIKFVVVSQLWYDHREKQTISVAHEETVDVNGDSEVTEMMLGGGPFAYDGIAGKFSTTYNPLVVLVRGDIHSCRVDYHYKQPVNSSQKPLAFYDIVGGSVNAQFAQGVLLENMPPHSRTGSHSVWVPPGTNNEKTYLGNDTTHRRYWNVCEFHIKKVSDGYTVGVKLYDAKVGQYLYQDTLDTRKTNAPEYLRYGSI